MLGKVGNNIFLSRKLEEGFYSFNVFKISEYGHLQA